ncbi:unnamed protein product [Trichobilharzia regenti]|nr:unnamed protein product [Trichobilharzia regenti]
MAPGKSLNLRGGSVSPGARSYEASVIKVGGEVFDPDGYRMDVTVWFRHRNEALYCFIENLKHFLFSNELFICHVYIISRQ